MWVIVEFAGCQIFYIITFHKGKWAEITMDRNPARQVRITLIRAEITRMIAIQGGLWYNIYNIDIGHSDRRLSVPVFVTLPKSPATFRAGLFSGFFPIEFMRFVLTSSPHNVTIFL